MRYYEIKPAIHAENLDFNYLDALKNIVCANTQMNPAQFLRMSSLYSRIKDATEGDVIEIEDQDYGILTTKLDAWLSNFNGGAIRFPEIADFIKYFQALPIKKVENKTEETK